ncbi:hypothetical protein [Pedobacter sp.]|uniref:hypothetical protein n=1 Tax=Pedobacter sp. TaxID=1411316 RepID=UPI0031DD20C0
MQVSNPDEDFKFPKSIKIIAILFAVFIFGVIIILGHFGFFDHSVRNHILAEEYTGKVVYLFNDRRNHNAYTAKLSNGITITNYFPLEKGEPLLELNDSIVKQRNSVYILVFKNGKFHRSLNTLYIDD